MEKLPYTSHRLRLLYIVLFIVLGVLVQFVLHGVIESGYIELLVKYPLLWLGFSFDTWLLIHNIFTAILLLLGVLIGYRQGVYWWDRIYGDTARKRI